MQVHGYPLYRRRQPSSSAAAAAEPPPRLKFATSDAASSSSSSFSASAPSSSSSSMNRGPLGAPRGGGGKGSVIGGGVRTDYVYKCSLNGEERSKPCNNQTVNNQAASQKLHRPNERNRNDTPNECLIYFVLSLSFGSCLLSSHLIFSDFFFVLHFLRFVLSFGVACGMRRGWGRQVAFDGRRRPLLHEP